MFVRIHNLGYVRNFMNMLWDGWSPKFRCQPVLARALEMIFILHADHEQNCGTNVMRCGRQRPGRSLSGYRRRGGGALGSATWAA